MRFIEARLQAELSRCMYSLARVRAVDPTRRRAGVPLVDRRVVLHARVGTLPGRLGDLAHELTGADGSDRLAAGDGLQLPVLVLLVGAA